MLREDKNYKRFLGRSTFDEANYYQGNNFQLGGSDRRKLHFSENSPSKVYGNGLNRADEKIQEDVWLALSKNLKVEISNIEVFVKNGVVNFSGTVNRLCEKREVENCMEHISGVTDVVNDLQVIRTYG